MWVGSPRLGLNLSSVSKCGSGQSGHYDPKPENETDRKLKPADRQRWKQLDQRPRTLRRVRRSLAAYREVMAHAHPAHSPSHAEADRGKLSRTLALILAFIAAEVAIAVVAHSLALLSDAAHMLTDAAAIGLSLVALRLAARPAAGALTFGLKRVEILSAQVNGVSLLILAAFITYEAIDRLFSPPEVRAGLVLGVALLGVLVNLAAVRMLAGAHRASLNVEGGFQHVAFNVEEIEGPNLRSSLVGGADGLAGASGPSLK